MATTIRQNGFEFTYIHKVQGSLPEVESWEIERVASFMFLIEFHRARSQKYSKGRTYINKYGRIQYELEDIDDNTNKDLDLMTKRLGTLISSEEQYNQLWVMEFAKALDYLEALLKSYISDRNTPVEVMGKSVVIGTEFVRATKDEYDTLLAAQRAADEEEAQRLKEKRAKAVTPGVVPVTTGQTIKFDFIKHGVLECEVIGIVGRSYICKVYKDGVCIDDACKIGRNSKRIVG